ncbi:HARBI1 [Mytilus coruscus]|uniref:Putative nuclease HARBI1 n=1 Tax=Mytilus coruscus TaxID=42192 RepID=A0A6J8A2F1_MYTCO|nr:HARBI1 [Mytilus coruscus]
MQKKWIEHACNLKGCKDRYCTIDGNEKLRRSICDNGGDKIIKDEGLTVQDCCPEDPEFGGKHCKPNRRAQSDISETNKIEYSTVDATEQTFDSEIYKLLPGVVIVLKDMGRYDDFLSLLQRISDWGSVGLYDKSTVISRAVDNWTNTILARKIDFISWPTSKTDVDEVKTGFHEQADFLHVVGCIDCTHVRIQKPSEDEAAFVNRTNFSSINFQAVCNHEGKFTQITAYWPGSVHDSQLFKTSPICKHLEKNHRGLVDAVLLSDSGYGCRQFLLTPYNNPQEPRQERCSRSHVSTRSLIERTLGVVWKRRFHVLHSEIRMKPGKVCRIIGACAVLHNSCHKKGTSC